MFSMMKLAMSEAVSQALQLMGQGMLGIFVVIIVIALVVYLLTHMQRKK